MKDLDYDRIQEIEISATEKLLKYISRKIQGKDILDRIEFFYPDFGEYRHKLAFNMWVSLDFLDKDGRTFIERFLAEKSINLTDEERAILQDRKDSRVSLFEVLEIQGENIRIMDLLQNQVHILWEPELVSVLPKGDLIFGRIGSFLDYSAFIGDINYLPDSVKDDFIEETLIDLNILRTNSPHLTMGEYMKKHSINLYKIYTNSVFEAIELEDDIDAMVYDELDEFEAYLQMKSSSLTIKQDISNLIDFFEYYLVDEELTLYDLDQVDLNDFFQLAIEDGFIVSHEDLNSYIATFKKYLKFLSNKDHDYKEVYKAILDISESRFEYMNKLKYVKSPFLIDKSLSNSVSNHLNEDAISIIMDYDKFILYVLDSSLSLTEKNRFIKKKNLLEINEILESNSHMERKASNQRDFPIIDLFYNLSLKLGMVSIDDHTLNITQKGMNYLRLRDEDKYSMFFQYIWNNDFISLVANVDKSKSMESIKNKLIDLLASLEEDRNYEITTVVSKFSAYPRFFFAYYLYLQYLGIIQCSLYPSYEIKVTPLGKKVLAILQERNCKRSKCPVIYLEQYKKS